MTAVSSPLRAARIGIGAVALAGLLAGCGGSATAGAAATPSSAPIDAGQGGPPPGGLPGASGIIAGASPGTLEVQSPSVGEVTVSYGAGTTFSRTVTAALSAVTPGECVTASAAAAAGATPAPASSAAPVTAFAAAMVSITPPAGGGCRAFAGRTRAPGGARPSGGTGGSYFGGGGGGAGRRAQGGFGPRATGTVSAVSGGVLTVAVPARGSRPATTDMITTTATTRFTTREAGTAKDITVGQCAVATGKADTAGTIAATRIALSPAGPDGCTVGRGAGGNGGA